MGLKVHLPRQVFVFLGLGHHERAKIRGTTVTREREAAEGLSEREQGRPCPHVRSCGGNGRAIEVASLLGNGSRCRLLGSVSAVTRRRSSLRCQVICSLFVGYASLRPKCHLFRCLRSDEATSVRSVCPHDIFLLYLDSDDGVSDGLFELLFSPCLVCHKKL